jgi:hypothetical protein
VKNLRTRQIDVGKFWGCETKSEAARPHLTCRRWRAPLGKWRFSFDFGAIRPLFYRPDRFKSSGVSPERGSRRAKWRGGFLSPRAKAIKESGKQMYSASLKPAVLCFGFLQHRYVGICVVPKCQERLMGSFRVVLSPDRANTLPSCRCASAPIGSSATIPR